MASWNVFRGIRLRELKKKIRVGTALPELDFRLDEAAMRELAARFSAFPGAVQQAILLATDRTRLFTRNELVRQYKALLTLKPAYIGRGISSRKARPVSGGAEAEIRIATSNIPLGRYSVSPERPPQLKGVPVAARRRTTYSLRQGGRQFGDAPRAQDATGKLFVQGMGSGHIGGFYRSGASIVQEWAPSLQYHAYADGFMERVSSLSAARFRENFANEAGRITGVRA